MPLQVIGGESRGRRLKTPPTGIRPTAAIVRRSLFDILGPRVIDARVLDLYAGSGALGIEALSRGAAWCDFIESNRRCANVITENLAAIGAVEEGRVHCAPAMGWARRNRQELTGYQLVLADPPYGDSGLLDVIKLLAEPEVLNASALLVVEESSARRLAAVGCLEVSREVRHGGSALTFMRPAR